MDSATLSILYQSIATFTLFVCNINAFRFVSNYLEKDKSNFIVYVLLPFINAVLFYFLVQMVPMPILCIVCLIVVTIEIAVCFEASFMHSIFSSCMISLQLFCLHGIMAGIFSILLKKNLYQLIQNEVTYYGIFTVTFIMLLIMMIPYRKQSNYDRLKTLIHCSSQVRFVVNCEIALYIYVMFSTYSYYYNFDLVWFSLSQIITSVLMFVIYYIIMYYGVKISYLLEYEITSRQFEAQLKRQILHYNSYKKYTRNLRNFRHKYKEMMGSISYLLSNDQIEEARSLISKINDDMHYNLGVHKEYSNNELVDAILQDVSNMCQGYHINFDARGYIPNGLSITDLDLCRIFTSISNNAMEASEEIVNEEDRFFNINSTTKNNWLTITFKNSFEGTISYHNGEFTNHLYQLTYGTGLEEARKTVERGSGMFILDIDNDHHIFTIHIQLKFDETKSNEEDVDNE